MKNLFKKTQAASGDSSSLVTPKKHTLKTNKSPSTPPITPSPTKSDDAAIPGLSVKIVPSQKEHSSQRPQETTIKTDDANDIYNDLSKSNEDESTLFAAVLGLGCGSPIWNVSTTTSNDYSSSSSPRRILGTHLTPIPEETITSSSESRKHEWGIAPVASFDDEETETSAENHDDFEIVLQQQEGSRNSLLLCQPCEEDSTDAKPKRRFKFPKLKSSKDKKNVEMQQEHIFSRSSIAEGSVVSNSTSTSATPAQETKSAVNKDRRKVQIGKIFHARFHKNHKHHDRHQKDIATDTVQKDDADNVDGSQDTIPKQKTTTKKKSQSKHGKWKCVQDPSSKRAYYYHTVTREVTWDRPLGFVEWKVARDMNKKPYFYNVITRETRWDMPPNFQLWREVRDKNSGNNYYYNVLTKETSWVKPEESQCDNLARDDNGPDGNVVQVLVTDSSQKPEESLHEGTKQTTLIEDVVAVSTLTIQDDGKDTSNHDSMDLKSSVAVSTDVTFTEDPPRIFKTDNHIRLERLLSTYCPDERENNAQLLEKCKGQETPIIKALEGLVEDTPFDELRLTIFSFVKTVLIEMGEQPFDERKTARKYASTTQPRSSAPLQFSTTTRPSPKRINRVNTYASNAVSVAGYSLGSRALSHMTGRSGTTNVTEQTNRVNNTSSRVLNSKEVHNLEGVNENYATESIENSFEDLTDITDDEIQKNVVLDMKDVQNHFDLLPASKSVKAQCEKSSEQTNEQEKITTIDTGDAFVTENNDSMTIESAYAADNDEETDHNVWEGLEDADDVSALSDSFGHTTKKKYRNQKKVLSSTGEYLKNKKISSKARGGLEKQNGQDYAVMFVGANVATQPEKSLYTSLKPHPRGSIHSTSSAELSSLGYEELPRLHARNGRRKDSDSLSSWDTESTGSE
mmetsp:Transcript_1212/g.2206  ORF Transcript_1212/g.2206 Transcript_1212/m.2206 type:complete len:909 (-) Transcript_1212:94-2820(-)|eukprot:CAMPEP_0176498816 /NCGR_PEP_ID=MMETSP0200_2-20121128/12555_1 /TAXON_ID=947934 /ORGANISM="Chaetoceros sp., Strain GSL56" /LENGTH=908 /DNA_ID=CAMNT_0017897113 /DNA_START=199 /DNA_END=2925 /DNA_ORIENTATION=+